MRLEGVTEEELKRALSSILAARSIESSSLLQLEVVTARVGQARAEAREREVALAEVLVRIARAQLLRFRASAPDAATAPTFDDDPRAAIAFDFQCGSVEQEAWSCLYYRYLGVIPLPVQDIAAVVQPGSPNARRLVSRRLARGYALLLRELHKMEQQSIAQRESAPGHAARAARVAAVANAARPLDAPPRIARRLPSPLSSFVGREEQLATLRAFLERARLLTLVGPGGVGKTRLALRLADEHESSLDGATAFIDLTSVTDGARLPREIAKAVGIRNAPPGREIDIVVEVLLSRPWLLLIDNCEHLVEPVAEQARTLLESVSSLRVLATSREALGIPGEQVAPIPPLGLPEEARGGEGEASDANADVDAVARSEAVRLFVERAQSAQPSFALDAESLPAVVDICRRLDGLPLAIELAASRVRSLTPAEIAHRLDRPFEQSGVLPRATDERQQTLWGAIEWSHALLSEPERRAFRRLAVFPGRFGRDAARAVIVSAGDEAEDEGTLDAVLDQLVAKSLLRVEPDGGRTSLRMLETIRAFASVRLAEALETEPARDRVLAWCDALVREAEPHLLGADQLPWLDRIDGDFETIVAAIEHALDSSDEQRAAAARIVGGLDMYGLYRGHGVELAAWLDRLLADSSSHDARGRARLEMAAAVVAISDKRSADARGHAEAAVAGYEALGDAHNESRARYLLATALHHQSHNDEAAAELERLLEVFRAQDEQRMVGRTLGLLASIELDRQRIDESLALGDESIEILRRHGNPHDHAIGTLNRAMTLSYTDRLEESRKEFHENRERYARIGSEPGVAMSDANLGVVLENLGRYDEAREAYARAERYYRDQGNVCLRALVQTNQVHLSLLEGQATDLLPQALESLRLAVRCGTDRVRVLALAVSSRSALNSGHPRFALRLRTATRRVRARLGPTFPDEEFIAQQIPTDEAIAEHVNAEEVRRIETEAAAADLDALIVRLAAGVHGAPGT